VKYSEEEEEPNSLLPHEFKGIMAYSLDDSGSFGDFVGTPSKTSMTFQQKKHK
jgi:hypothetical protein